jgi:hypothetical protein
MCAQPAGMTPSTAKVLTARQGRRALLGVIAVNVGVPGTSPR